MKPSPVGVVREKPKRDDDEASFWRKWPSASRYFTQAERERYEREIPGWFPGCNLNSLLSHQFLLGQSPPSPLKSDSSKAEVGE